MKKVLIIIIGVLFISANARSNNWYPGIAWMHAFNCNLVAIEYSGDFIYTAGSFSDSAFVFGNANIPNNPGRDVVIMKWDTLGNMIWARNIWGAGQDSVVSLEVNANNELIVAGSSNSALLHIGVNTLSSNGGFDIYTAKFDLNGNVLNGYNYGTAADEYAIDMCTDYQNSVYVASEGKLTKYNAAGTQVWQKNITATYSCVIRELRYSSFDSTIVFSTMYAGTSAVDAFSVTALYTCCPATQTDLYLCKLDINGTAQWLTNIASSLITYGGNFYISNATGKIYCAHGNASILMGAFYYLYEILSNGNIANTNWPELAGIMMPNNPDFGNETWSVSGSGNYVSYYLSGNALGGIVIVDLNTQQVVEIHNVWGLTNPRTHLFRGINSMYVLGITVNQGNNNIINGNIAKIGNQGLYYTGAYPNPLNVCAGNTVTLTGHITGGTGPLSYSWLPVTGLNNVNTNVVSFTATSNITYTLTVTDSIGQVLTEVINVIVNPVYTNTTTITICANQAPYVWNGQSLVNAGTYTNISPAMNGCDSTEILILNINPVSGSTTNTIICSNQIPYGWNGQSILSAGTYTYTTVNALGCDSIAVLNLTISQPSPVIVQNNNLLTCTNVVSVSYQWLFNNNPTGTNDSTLVINQNGTYIVITTDSAGCTGTDTLVVVGLGIAANISEDPSILIYPNPASNQLTIEYKLEQSSVISMKFTDPAGKTVAEIVREEKQPQGQHKKMIRLKDYGLSRGTYFLQIDNGISKWTRRIVVE